jgi:hypothetical protein
MPKLRLSRRTVLRGAGSIAIALPWLEVMTAGRRAHAATPRPRRFLTVYTPGGTVRENWVPTGSETAFTLGPILKPLEPVQSRIIVADGLDMKCAPIGAAHQRASGMIGWLTGTTQTSSNSYATGPSIDQVLAPRLSAGKRFASMQMAVRWGTGQAHGLVSPFDIANYEAAAPHSPIPPRLDPADIWSQLFGVPGTTPDAAGWDRSILDFVGRRYTKLAARLGSADRQRLEQHLTGIREIEKGLATVAGCAPPALVDTSDYNPRSGLNSADNGSIRDLPTDGAIPKVGKLMADMMVMALACDLTAVGTLQWSDTQAKYTLPWLGLTEHHYFYQNDGGYKPAELTTIYTWYSTQHAYLLQQMARIDMGGHSLLDECVVFFGTEVQHPASHVKDNMPFLLAGGGMRTGRWIRCSNQSHNNLLVSLLNLFGDTRTTFGNPLYSTGPLTGVLLT